MASLALVVALMFMTVLLIGPLSYVLSSIKLVPNWIVWIISLLSMFVGAYWFVLPTGILRFVGLMSIGLGYLALRKRNNNNAYLSDNNS